MVEWKSDEHPVKEDVILIKKKFWPLDGQTLPKLAIVLVGIAFYFFLYRFDDVQAKLSSFLSICTPFILGFALAYLLNSPMCFFEQKVFAKLKLRRGLSIVTVYCSALLILGILINLVVPQVVQSITDLIGNMQTYWTELSQLVQGLIARFHLEGNGITELFTSYQQLMSQATTLVTEAVPQLLTIGVAVGSGVITAVTTLISSIYMLASKDSLVKQTRKLTYALMPHDTAAHFLTVCHRANKIFSGFIMGKLLDSAIIGGLCFLLCSVIQVPYAVLISVIIGVTNIVPFFGPCIGAVPCLMILVMVDPWAALRFLVLVIALQQFDGNILGPKILGDSTGLSPIWVLVAIVVGGGLFGFPGMILGVPTFAVIYDLTRDWINGRLAKKGIDEFGNATSVPEETEEP